MVVVYLDEEKIGKVFRYFSQIGVIGVELEGPIKIGEKIRVYGAKTNFIQLVESIEVFSKSVTEAFAGQKVGIKVKYKCRKGDNVYKIHEF
ncbi:MAG: translation elongation factor-like protein [Promethearchaeota archaeon]